MPTGTYVVLAKLQQTYSEVLFLAAYSLMPVVEKLYKYTSATDFHTDVGSNSTPLGTDSPSDVGHGRNSKPDLPIHTGLLLAPCEQTRQKMLIFSSSANLFKKM